MKFLEFSLIKPNDCENNFIDVFSDRTDIPSRLHSFCGSIGDTVASKKNVMFIRFFAKPKANESTFKALFTAYRDLGTSGYSRKLHEISFRMAHSKYKN